MISPGVLNSSCCTHATCTAQTICRVKIGQKQGINLGMKEDKPQAEAYHPFMNMFKKLDVMADKINDRFEILVIISLVSLDIH